MVQKFFALSLLLGSLFASPLLAQSYADQLLDQLEKEVHALESAPDPVQQLLLTERIYYLGHETGQQERVTALLNSLYQQATHNEAKVEIGYFLAQHCRQLGQYERSQEVTTGLGYVAEWQILGPLNLADPATFKLKSLYASSVPGKGRNVSPLVVRSYGATDYWDIGMGQYGFFNANNVVFPNQLAGMLATTWFELKETQTVRLGIGWSNKVRVWVNNTEIFEKSATQIAHPDQAVLEFSLKKGKHRLAIYQESASDDPDLGFFARLTDTTGQPIPAFAQGERSNPSKKPTVLPSSEPSLLKLASDKSAYALASTLLLKSMTQDPDYESPKSLLAKSLVAEGARQIVADKLLSLTEDPNEKWRILSDLIKAKPEKLDHAWALTQLGQLALGQERFWEARNLAAQAQALYPSYWPAQVVENNTLSALSIDGLALRNTLELVKEYPGVPWLTMDLSDLYWEMDYREEARRLTDQVLKVRGATTKFAERKIKLLQQVGNLDGLTAYYVELLRDSPFSIGTLLSYAEFLSANRRTEQAINLLGRYLVVLPENPNLLEQMGQLLLLQEKQTEALPYLEKAYALDPQNPGLEKLIAFNKQGEQPFYEPYRYSESPVAEVNEVSPIILNLDNTVVKVANSGLSSTYHQIEWAIVGEKGKSELPGYSFSYSPLRQRAEIIRAEIARGEKIIHLTQFGKARISDPAYRMYYDLVSYQIGFPPLEVGDLIRVEYRVDDTGNNIFGDYFGDITYFSDRYPAREYSYTIIMPEARQLYTHVERMEPSLVTKTEGKNKVYHWSLQSVAAIETESRMPGLGGYMPYVAVSTFSDWQKMASWYHNLIKDQLTLDHATKAIVQGLIEGQTDHLEIVKKIHEYVITHTRYVALEFGIHGYKPYDVNQINQRQFGDCKDKASLIVSMLREAGIDASIAIVRTVDKGQVNTFPAMLSYFNHAIAYVPEFDLFLDGTAEFSGIHELPTMDQGALTLVVDKNGIGNLTHIPVSNKDERDFDLHLDFASSGQTEVSGSVSYQGSSTSGLREYLSIDTKLAENLQNLMRDTLPGLDVAEAKREGRTINEPITLRFSGKTDQLLKRSDGKLSLPLRFLGSSLTQQYAANATRRFPLEFGVPKTLSVGVEIKAPKGYDLGRLPASQTVGDENFSVSFKVEGTDPRTCQVSYLVEFKAIRIEPDDYPKLRKFMQEHDRLLDQTIQFIAQ